MKKGIYINSAEVCFRYFFCRPSPLLLEIAYCCEVAGEGECKKQVTPIAFASNKYSRVLEFTQRKIYV